MDLSASIQLHPSSSSLRVGMQHSCESESLQLVANLAALWHMAVGTLTLQWHVWGWQCRCRLPSEHCCSAGSCTVHPTLGSLPL